MKTGIPKSQDVVIGNQVEKLKIMHDNLTNLDLTEIRGRVSDESLSECQKHRDLLTPKWEFHCQFASRPLPDQLLQTFAATRVMSSADLSPLV